VLVLTAIVILVVLGPVRYSLLIYCLVYIAFFLVKRGSIDKIGRRRTGTYNTARKTYDIETRPAPYCTNLAPWRLIRLSD